MDDISLHDIEVEEQHDQNQRKDRADSDDFHRKITLCTHDILFYIAFTAHFFGSQSDGTLDDSPRTDNTDDTCHGNTADTDALGVILEDFFGAHHAYRRSDFGVPCVQHAVSPDGGHSRNDDPPYCQ